MDTDDRNKKLICEITANMVRDGFVPGTEQYEVCMVALGYLGYSYERNEELVSGTVIDCSTLTSQALWLGAAIGIPFVADNQRTAASGKTILSLGEMIPGDVVIKYPSLEEALPEKKWNHVGLYLGRDNQGCQWLIESASKTGACLSRVMDFNPQGGIKRFTLSREVFDSPQAKAVLALTRLVPKFGRLGVRQYCKFGERRVHNGIDLYVSIGTPVYASIEGTVCLYTQADGEQLVGIEINSPDTGFLISYLHMGDIQKDTGNLVKEGDLLGFVSLPNKNSDVIYSPTATGRSSHLHLEVFGIGSGKYLNHLYLSKTGVLGLPFKIE